MKLFQGTFLFLTIMNALVFAQTQVLGNETSKFTSKEYGYLLSDNTSDNLNRQNGKALEKEEYMSRSAYSRIFSIPENKQKSSNRFLTSISLVTMATGLSLGIWADNVAYDNSKKRILLGNFGESTEENIQKIKDYEQKIKTYNTVTAIGYGIFGLGSISLVFSLPF